MSDEEQIEMTLERLDASCQKDANDFTCRRSLPKDDAINLSPGTHMKTYPKSIALEIHDEFHRKS